jgi:hypothetical protein
MSIKSNFDHVATRSMLGGQFILLRSFPRGRETREPPFL